LTGGRAAATRLSQSRSGSLAEVALGPDARRDPSVSKKRRRSPKTGSRAHCSQIRWQEAEAAGATAPDVDLGWRRKEVGEGAKIENKADVEATVPEKRTPAPPGPTRSDLGFRGAQGEMKGKERGDTEGWRQTTKNAIHQPTSSIDGRDHGPTRTGDEPMLSEQREGAPVGEGHTRRRSPLARLSHGGARL
jgi:hypothetical protein